MFDFESLFTYSSLIFAFAIFIILLYGCLSGNYNNIEKFTEVKLDSPVSAVVDSLDVDDSGGIRDINFKSTPVGKYYNRTPPKVKFTKPSNGSVATGTIKLKTTSTQGSDYLYEIDSVTISQKGSNYTEDNKSLVVIENITEYISRANRENPIIYLDSTQKTTIKDLIEGCSSLNRETKLKYKNLIDIKALRQYDVDDIINILNTATRTESSESSVASATPPTPTRASTSATSSTSTPPATSSATPASSSATPSTSTTSSTSSATPATPATSSATPATSSATPATSSATPATPATSSATSATSSTTPATSATSSATPATSSTPAARAN